MNSAVEQELKLDFSGGLVTALDASQIGANDCSAMENADIRSGNPRLDQRYKQAFDQHTFNGSLAQGCGWGKYGSGTLSNQYVSVIRAADGSRNLWEYDLTAASLSGVIASTNVGAGDWFFQQFQNYIYGINSAAGIGRKLIGPGVNGHGDWTMLVVPAAPGSAPTAPPDSASQVQAVWGATGVGVVAPGSKQYIAGSDTFLLTWTSGQAGLATLTITFSVGHHPDWSYHDTISHFLSLGTGVLLNSVDIYSASLASSVGHVRALEWIPSSITGPIQNECFHRISNIARSDRADITKVVYTFAVPSNGGMAVLSSPIAYGVWLSLDEGTTVGLNQDPPLGPLIYEQTFLNSSTNFESPPSPALTIAASAQSRYGEWRDVTGVSTGASGVDKVNFYRRIDEGGVSTRYLIGQVPNAGTPTMVDKLTANEVKALPTYTASILPVSNLSAIGVWLNRMVLASGPIVYISRSENPLQFEPITGAFDLTNQARGVTFYTDDRRAENVLGLCPQNSLYIITDYSVRCLFGTTPDNWRLVRMPDSEGAVGPRAWAPYRGGVLVLTPSGRLLYHHLDYYSTTYDQVQQLLPQEVSAKLRKRIGNAGIAEMATVDATVSVRPDGQIEIRNQAGRYYVLDVDGRWRRGKHFDGTQSTLFISGLPLRWIGKNGRLYEGGDDTFVTDGGVSGSTGVPVEFSVTSRKMLIDRSSIQHLNWGETPDSIQDDAVLYPKANIFTTRFPAGKTYVKLRGRRDMKIPIENAGQGITVQIIGDELTPIDEARLVLVGASPQRHR